MIMVFKRFRVIIVFISLIVLGGVLPISADEPPTNEQLVVSSVARSIRIFLDSLQLIPSNVLIEKVDGLNGLVVDGVRSAFINAGWKILNRIDENPYYLVSANLSAFEFNYKKGRSRGFMNKPFIRRELTGQILLSVIGNTYNYMDFVEFAGGDEVLSEQANYIASVRYQQLAPKVPGSGVMKYLEPLAVTATVGGLIYLFFINR